MSPNLSWGTSPTARTVSRCPPCPERSPHPARGAIPLFPDEGGPPSLFETRYDGRAFSRVVQILIPSSRASLAPRLGQQSHPNPGRFVRLPTARQIQPPTAQTQRTRSMDSRWALNSRIPSSKLSRGTRRGWLARSIVESLPSSPPQADDLSSVPDPTASR